MGLLPRSRHPRITHWKVTRRRTKPGEAEGHRVKSIWYMSTEKTNLLTVDSNKSHLNRLPARYIANATQCHSIHAPLVLSLTVIASKLAPSSILGFLFPTNRHSGDQLVRWRRSRIRLDQLLLAINIEFLISLADMAVFFLLLRTICCPDPVCIRATLTLSVLKWTSCIHARVKFAGSL